MPKDLKKLQKREADGFKHPTLYYMDEQIYSADSSVNEILKIYFPEQFGEREFWIILWGISS